jgi:hypothetical protein
MSFVTPSVVLLARVIVSISGPDDGVLQESFDDGYTWRDVCELPCEAMVTAAPEADHRVVAPGRRSHRVDIRGSDGERTEVRIEPKSAHPARGPLLVSGILTASVGGVLMIVGSFMGLANACIYDDACSDGSRDRGHTAGALIVTGFSLGIIGGALFVTRALLRRPSTSSVQAGWGGVAIRF